MRIDTFIRVLNALPSAGFLAIVLLAITGQVVRAQAAPVVDISNSGQNSGSSLQLIQEIDAIRREMSELRDLTERQGYELNQFKRQSDQEIARLRARLDALQKGAGAIPESDGTFGNVSPEPTSGFTLGVSEGISEQQEPVPEASELENAPGLVNQADQAVTIPAKNGPDVSETLPEIQPEVGTVGISGGGGEQSTAANTNVTDVTVSNNQGNSVSGVVVVPRSAGSIARPVTVEVVRDVGQGSPQVSTRSTALGTTAPASPQPVPQAVQPAAQQVTTQTIGANSSLPQTQPGYGASQSNDSELQWQVISSPLPESTPLDDAPTSDVGESRPLSSPAQTPTQLNPSADDVLGDL